MNGSSVIKDGRKELEILFYEVPVLYVKQWSVIWKWNLDFKMYVVNQRATIKIFLKDILGRYQMESYEMLD